MIGDLIIKIREQLKQIFCFHDYKLDKTIIGLTGDWNIYVCDKCGRIKSERI